MALLRGLRDLYGETAGDFILFAIAPVSCYLRCSQAHTENCRFIPNF